MDPLNNSRSSNQGNSNADVSVEQAHLPAAESPLRPSSADVDEAYRSTQESQQPSSADSERKKSFDGAASSQEEQAIEAPHIGACQSHANTPHLCLRLPPLLLTEKEALEEENGNPRASKCEIPAPPQLAGKQIEAEEDTTPHPWWFLLAKLGIRDGEPYIIDTEQLYVLGSCSRSSDMAEEFMGEGWHVVASEYEHGWLEHPMSGIADAPLTAETPVIHCWGPRD